MNLTKTCCLSFSSRRPCWSLVRSFIFSPIIFVDRQTKQIDARSARSKTSRKLRDDSSHFDQSSFSFPSMKIDRRTLFSVVALRFRHRHSNGSGRSSNVRFGRFWCHKKRSRRWKTSVSEENSVDRRLFDSSFSLWNFDDQNRRSDNQHKQSIGGSSERSDGVETDQRIDGLRPFGLSSEDKRFDSTLLVFLLLDDSATFEFKTKTNRQSKSDETRLNESSIGREISTRSRLSVFRQGNIVGQRIDRRSSHRRRDRPGKISFSRWDSEGRVNPSDWKSSHLR